jgi:CRISPR-associated protein Cas1
VLVGHGVRLRVHQGTLLVQNGFTHYPQKREELRLFLGDRRLPSRIIALDSDGSISLDVIKWLPSSGSRSSY